jgi:hypothetical protein
MILISEAAFNPFAALAAHTGASLKAPTIVNV